MAGRPPGPRGRWLVGNTYDYDQDRIGFLRRCQAEYGDVFSFSPTTIVVCDPDLIHELLAESNEAFLAESPLFPRSESDAQIERNVAGWMCGRRVGWQALTRAVTRAHGSRMLTGFDEALRAVGGQETDVFTIMRGYSPRMAVDFFFGPNAQDVLAAVDLRSELSVRFMSTNLTIPRWLPLPSVRRVLLAEEKMRSAIMGHVRRRRAQPHEEPQDMVDLLVSGAETPLSEDDILLVLKAGMLASFGPPGAALSWLVYQMSRDTEAHSKLRDEALRAIGDTGSLVDDSNRPYTKAFVRELLRLYPPIWLMGRAVRRPCTLGGWALSRGDNVMFSPYLLLQDPRWWREPGEFRPERWLGPVSPESRRAYIPFGSGPRICFGLHLAVYQLMLAASHLAAHYRIEPDATEVRAFPHALLLPRDFRARFIPAGDPAPGGGLPTPAAEVMS
jgi:unspecific monooxygenase